MDAAQKLPRSLDQVQSPQHDLWRKGVTQLKRIPVEELWPGCISLAVVYEPGNFIPPSPYIPEGGFVRNLSFVVMRTIRVAHYRGVPNREARLVSVTEPRIHHGAIVIDTNHNDLSFDFRNCPFSQLKRGKRLLTAGKAGFEDTLNADEDPQMFAVANALVANANSTGMKFRGSWKARLKTTEDGKILCGKDLALDRPARVENWFPVPYVAVPEGLSADDILREAVVNGLLSAPIRKDFVLAVGAGLPVESPVAGFYLGKRKPRGEYSDWERKHCSEFLFGRTKHDKEPVVVLLPINTTIHRGFREPVRVGEEIGFAAPELPAKFKRLRLEEAWRFLRHDWTPEMLEFLLRRWVATQAVLIDDKPCLPFHFLSIHSTKHGSCEVMGWDIRTLKHYANDSLRMGDMPFEVCITPGLRQCAWDDLRHAMPWDVALDATDSRILDKPQPRPPKIEDHLEASAEEPVEEQAAVHSPVEIKHVVLA